MRTLLKIQLPPSADAAPPGDMMARTLEALQPEAVYFYPENGRRTALIVFDLADPSMMPAIAAPIHARFGADIQFAPVMNLEDFQRAMERLAEVQLQPA